MKSHLVVSNIFKKSNWYVGRTYNQEQICQKIMFKYEFMFAIMTGKVPILALIFWVQLEKRPEFLETVCESAISMRIPMCVTI